MCHIKKVWTRKELALIRDNCDLMKNSWGMTGRAGTALWQPWGWPGVWCDSRLLTAVNIRLIAFSKNGWEWRCKGNIKYLWFICLFITTINGRHTCGKTPPIFVRGRCLEAGGSQPEQSISVSCVCAWGTGGVLEAHIFECSASEGQSTFQNVSTALTLLSNFSIDPRRQMGDRLSEQQAHPSLNVFLTNGAIVILLLTLLYLSSI